MEPSPSIDRPGAQVCTVGRQWRSNGIPRCRLADATRRARTAAARTAGAGVDAGMVEVVVAVSSVPPAGQPKAAAACRPRHGATAHSTEHLSASSLCSERRGRGMEIRPASAARQRRGCESQACAGLQEGRREETARTPDLGSEGAEEAGDGRSGWRRRARTRRHHGPVFPHLVVAARPDGQQQELQNFTRDQG
nr:uncharacterized protein LOC127308135 [Lolium perenne]